ncbi:MAG: glycosyl transferase family 1 [Herbaspirillum sp.]|nr:glycosyl transferase family 1 [Herbaspirillum sp.]
MRKTIIGMLLATSLLVSGAAANAADINVANSLVQFNGTPLTTSFSATLGAGNKGLTFNEIFGVEFLRPAAFGASVAVLGPFFGLDITGFTLSNFNTQTTFTTGVPDVTLPGFDTWVLGAFVPEGRYLLNVLGTVTGTHGGSLGGNVNIIPIPEASTWAMLLSGLALVGFAATRRRRNKDTEPPTGMFTA